MGLQLLCENLTGAIQLAASLVAIVALAWVAHRLQLGGDARIRTEDGADVALVTQMLDELLTPHKIPFCVACQDEGFDWFEV